jgi:hypothetical protein
MDNFLVTIRPSIIASEIWTRSCRDAKKGPSAELGEVPLHGPRGHHSWTLSFRERNGGGQGKD